MTTGEIISISVGGIVTLITGILLWILKSYITELKQYRDKREKEEKAKDDLLLGIARVMLLENYRKCEDKEFYSMEDREVYGKLFIAYQASGGNGIIDQLGSKLREMPTHQPAPIVS